MKPKTDLIHLPGMPLGWERRDGLVCPVFVCSQTGAPITPGNPGTLYWDPDTGRMAVVSVRADDRLDVTSTEYPYTTEMHLVALQIANNTVGPPGSESRKKYTQRAIRFDESFAAA